MTLAGCDRGSEETGSEAGPPRVHAALDWFREVTEASGVAFAHLADTNYFMPDQMGSGVVLFDGDQDGRLDIYLVQNAPSTAGERGRNRLFRQGEDGRFTDVSVGSGADLVGRGMGAIAGDVNNDGLPDLVVTEYGATRLLRNLGGARFEEVTRAAGIDNPRWAVPASFIDFDRDGWLDLVVGNYLDYDPTQVCHDVHGRRDFCAPQAFPPTLTRLWRNRTARAGASPSFEDWTERSGLSRVPGAALGLVCADFNGDRWPDIFCSDDGRPNRLFINRGDGTFVDEALTRGLALNAMGRTAANMGVAFADADGDGLTDLFVSHLTEEFHSLFRQDRPGFFLDVVARAGLQKQGWRGTGFGTGLADFDLDGDLDLVLVNGLIRHAIPGQKPVASGVSPWWARYAQRAQIFANQGGGRFEDRSGDHPSFCGLAVVGRSLALGDLDRDGAVDLAVGTVGGPVLLYRNVAPRLGHWLHVRVVDPARGGRDALGAEVILRDEHRIQGQVLQPATSYLASHEPVLHFGLGPEPRVRGIEVRWPDGSTEAFPAPAVDRIVVLKRGEGSSIR